METVTSRSSVDSPGVVSPDHLGLRLVMVASERQARCGVVWAGLDPAQIGAKLGLSATTGSKSATSRRLNWLLKSAI